MKRLKTVVLLCATILLSAVQLNAQKYGVLAGATFSNMRGIENSSKTGWNVGGTVQFKLPFGFSVQPSLIYNAKAAQVGLDAGSADLTVGYLELPVSFQWGPDLLLFRPFLDASPYVGYALTSKFLPEWNTSNLEKLEYGLALGGGIELWRMQLTCRYCWSFGSLIGAEIPDDLAEIKGKFGNNNFGGVTLSLAFLFGN